MSRKYKFVNSEELYFITFSVTNWIDALTRLEYRDIIIESLKFCQKEKDLDIFTYCIMTNHIHLIVRTRGRLLSNTFRDLKQFTAKRILKAIEDNPFESRKEWLLWFFERAGKKSAANEKYQFWQHDLHPIELYSAEILHQKLHYIHNNPVVEGFVIRQEDWLYSSAKNYYTNEPPLLDVILIE